MHFPDPFAKIIPRSPDDEGGGGDTTITDDAGSGGGDGGDGSGHYNPEEPRDWHGRWTSGPDGQDGGRNLLDVADKGGASLPETYISLETNGTPNLLDQATAPPAWKADVFAGQPGAWDGFNTAVAGLPGIGDAEAFSYGEIFAAEGGIAVDRDSRRKTSSGITIRTLTDAMKGVPGLKGTATPNLLTLPQRAAVYRDYFERGLRTVGGYKALEAVGNPFATSALADTLFRFGVGGGTKLIQQALDQVMPGVVGADGHMGPGTFGVFREFVSAPTTRGRLLDALYRVRSKQLDGLEEDRNQHFRYLRER